MVAGTESSETVLEDRGHSSRGHSIGRRAAGGAFWVFLAFAAAKLLGFVTDLILARLLSPADFGVVSFAMILIGAFSLVQDLGVPTAIVYGQSDISSVGGTALTINVLAATLLFGVTVLASPLVASFGKSAELRPIAIVLAVSLVVSSLGSVQEALLVKELAFRRKFMPDVLPLFISGFASIAFALVGFGVWSIVLGNLISAGTSTILLWWVTSIRLRPGFDRTVAAELIRYGKHVSMTTVIGFIGLNVDYLIIGHSLGAFRLGIYTMAFTIATLPSTAISQVAAQAVFPAYSRIKDDRVALSQLFATVFHLISLVAIPAGIGIFICGPAFTSVLLSAKWATVVNPLRVLAIYGMLRAVAWTFPPAYKAVGRPDVEWKVTLVKVLVLTPLIVLSLRYGVFGVGCAQAIVALFIVPLNAIAVSRVMHLANRELWHLIKPQVAGVCGATLLIAIGYGIPVLRVVVTSPAGSIGLAASALSAYAAITVRMNPQVFAPVKVGVASLYKKALVTAE